MLSSHFRAAKSRTLSTTDKSLNTEQTSQMKDQPEIEIVPVAPLPAANDQAVTDNPPGTTSNMGQISKFDAETERSLEVSLFTMNHQTAAGGKFSPTATSIVAEETIVSPEAITLLANIAQEPYQLMAADTDTPRSTADTATPEQGADDDRTFDTLLQYLPENGGVEDHFAAAQIPVTQESSYDTVLSIEASSDSIGQSGTSENTVSKDDTITSAVQVTFGGAHGAISADGNLNYNRSLCKYRLSAAIPSFRDRAQSVPPACSKHYTYLASWPPPEAPRCDFGQRIDIFPPKDAPLHVWIQAYALRWGVWSSEVKDDAKRAQLLDVIADKMKAAWETAIIEGYYARPRETIVDMTYARADGDGQGSQDKRGRKRAQSPSKLPAGFAHEGKDPYAVTNGELAQNQITMEMVKKRVQERDYDDGERLLDDVLGRLPDGRERLTERDWSATYHSSVRGRNLLMYSLWAVQEARNNITKLNKLMQHFTKEQQKKNTQSRIDMYQEREAQHLALATELKLQQSNDQDAADEDNMQTDSIDITNETGAKDAEYADETLARTQALSEDVIIDLAREVLSASKEQTLLQCFTTRELRADDFMSSGSLTVGVNDKLQAASIILEDIYRKIEHVVRFRNSMKGQQPAEMIRMGYDARLVRDQVDNARRRLGEVLKDDLQTTAIGALKAGDDISGSDDNEPAKDHEVYQDTGEFSTGDANSQEQSTLCENVQSDPNFHSEDAPAATSIGTQYDPGANTNASPQPQASIVAPLMSPAAPSMSLRTSGSLQQSEDANQACYIAPPAQISPSPPTVSLLQIKADLKQSYINEKWIPFLTKALADQGLPPVSGTITLWPQIKDILTQLGFTADERNEQLRRFKSGFEAYAEGKGFARSTNVPSLSPTPSVPAPSPAMSHASLQTAAPPWPSDAEIQAAIPPQGIHGSQLMRLFEKRIGYYVPRFCRTVQRLALITPQQMVYPRPPMPLASRQYNTLPTPPARTLVMQSPQIPPASRILSPSQGQVRPGIVRLRCPPQPQSSPTPALPRQDESQFSEDFQSTLVQGSRGFSFRHLPHATLEQRERMDEEVGEYITRTCKARTKNPFGQYIAFKDPNDPAGPVILHGFWENKDRTRPEGSEWFFNGEDVPDNWDMDQGARIGAGAEVRSLGDGAYDDQCQYNQGTAGPGQARPKIKLKLNASAQGSMSGGRPGAQTPTGLSSNIIFQPDYGITPVSTALPTNMTRGRARDGYQPSYGMDSIDPAQLSIQHVQSDLQGHDQACTEGRSGGKKGTKRKRSASGSRGAGRKKRRKGKANANVELEDQDDSGDYDPGQAF